jgi:hypothetical protein
MTIQELQEIIIKNFKNKAGIIDISGMCFPTSVNMSNMLVNGDLYQNELAVAEDLNQRGLEVLGHLEQSGQEFKNFNDFQKKANKHLTYNSCKNDFKEVADFYDVKSAFLRFLGNGLTIRDLEVIIKNNFTRPNGTVDIRGLRFNDTVYMNDLEIDGFLRMDEIFVNSGKIIFTTEGIMKEKMTIEELNKIIIQNFTDENGVIDISGMSFHTDVNMSNMVVNGNLNQGCQKINGNLDQSGQEVTGNLEQRRQKIGGNSFQILQKVGGCLFQDYQDVCKNVYQSSQCVGEDVIQRDQNVGGCVKNSNVGLSTANQVVRESFKKKYPTLDITTHL